MNDHPKALVRQERSAGIGRRLVISVDRDNHFKVLKGLLLKRFQCSCNVVGAVVDRHSDSYARRQGSAPNVGQSHHADAAIRSAHLSAK